MKAISLTQPWASAVALGVKRIETRSWSTAHRGPLAIHAAQRIPGWVADWFTRQAVVRAALQAHGIASLRDLLDLPRGCVVATCELVECLRIPSSARAFQRSDLAHFMIPVWLPPVDPELTFGDYSPGRHAWVLANVQPLAQPVPASGGLGLWEWQPPAPPAPPQIEQSISTLEP